MIPISSLNRALPPTVHPTRGPPDMRDAEEKLGLPSYARDEHANARDTSRRHRHRRLRVVLGAALSLVTLQYLGISTQVWKAEERVQVPLRAQEWLEKCQLLDVPPGPPPDFHSRQLSDRFVSGTMPTFIAVSRLVYAWCLESTRLTMELRDIECDYLDRQREWPRRGQGGHPSRRRYHSTHLRGRSHYQGTWTARTFHVHRC